MFKEWRHRRAAQRVKPGDGRAVEAFPLVADAFPRTVLSSADERRRPADGLRRRRQAWQNQSSGNVKAHLYLDGRHHAESKVPAVFPVQGGTVEVRMSAFGLKRCHYVTAEGAEYQLVPDPASAEGRRARLDAIAPRTEPR